MHHIVVSTLVLAALSAMGGAAPQLGLEHLTNALLQLAEQLSSNYTSPIITKLGDNTLIISGIATASATASASQTSDGGSNYYGYWRDLIAGAAAEDANAPETEDAEDDATAEQPIRDDTEAAVEANVPDTEDAVDATAEEAVRDDIEEAAMWDYEANEE